MTCIRLDPSGNNLGGRGFIAQVQVRRHHQLQGNAHHHIDIVCIRRKNIVFTIINIITINLKATKINKFLQIKRPFPQLQKLIPVIIIDYYFKFLSQGFSASYVIIDESEGRDYEYIDKTIPS